MKKRGLAGLLVAVSVFAAPQVMTNQTVEAMVYGGVPLATIVATIKSAARIQLTETKPDYDRLVSAGSSPAAAAEIMKAIHSRQYNGVERWPARDATPSVQTAPAIAANPAQVASSPTVVTLPALALNPTVPNTVAATVDIAHLQPTMAQPAESSVPAAPVQAALVTYAPRSGPRIVLEDSTPVRLRLSETLSSADATTDQKIDFEVLEEIKVGDQIVIPKGSVAWGNVTEAQAKRRMGRAGKLDVALDKVRLADGEKAAIRGVKDAKGGSHAGAVTAAVVGTSLVVWPAAPLFLLIHGKDVTIPKGTEIIGYINGDMTLDGSKF